MKRTIRNSLIVLNVFLALTSIAGGIALIAGWNAPPVEVLGGSLFSSYLVPGLALFILVGGTAAFAAMVTFRDHHLAPAASYLAACAIVIFEIVEIAVIGSPEGVARNLQVFYLALGFCIGFLTAVLTRASPGSSKPRNP